MPDRLNVAGSMPLAHVALFNWVSLAFLRVYNWYVCVTGPPAGPGRETVFGTRSASPS